MPIYEFKCNQCGKNFEKLVFPSDDEGTFTCPSCGRKDVSRLLSAFARSSSNSLSGLANSVSSSCSPSGGFS
ncbi:MAG: zinc ribbon domain-containing protein [Deltaproteobacteria bacterium]|nr:zinc ribbon domain-containing protein [Deltaproteobacteria bacterium]